MDSTIVVALISAVVSLTTLIYQIVKDQRQNKSALSRAVGFLLLKAMTEEADVCIERGDITKQELKVIVECYELYHKLGGNGFADSVVASCQRLPIKGAHHEK